MDETRYRQFRRIVTVIRWVTAAVVVVAALVTVRQASGPVSIDWKPVSGPARSIVWAVAVDPADPDVIYAGTDGGGVYKSADGGRTWSARNDGLYWMKREEQVIPDVRDILISQTRPGTVYVATAGPEGIYASDDGGDSWWPQPIDFWAPLQDDDAPFVGERAYVRDLLETQAGLFAGTAVGVLRLDEEEEQWTPTGLNGRDLSVRALLVDPRDAMTLYAATLGQGVFKSVDNGVTWQPKNTGLDGESALAVNALALDPADADVIYAGAFGGGVYRSLDGGEHWAAWFEGLQENAEVWSLGFAADGALLAGLRFGGTYRRAGEAAWEPAGNIGALTLAAGPQGALYAGTWGGGVFRSAGEPDAQLQDWEHLGPPAGALQLRSALFVGADPVTLYVGADGDGVYASVDGGKSWERRSEGLRGSALTVRTLALAPDGRTLYAGTGAGVSVTTDAGKQWRTLGEFPLPPEKVSVLALAVQRDEGGADHVYAGTNWGLWSYDGAEAQWRGPQAFPFRSGVITEVRVPAVVVADGTAYASVWGLGVYRSDGAGGWSPVQMAPKYVSALAAAEKTLRQWGGKRIYALTEQGLYSSRDGAAWSPLEYGVLDAIAVDPLHPQVVYAGITLETASENAPAVAGGVTTTGIVTTTSVLASVNDGRAWSATQRQGRSPFDGQVTQLARAPGDPRQIVALSSGGGLYLGRVVLPWLVWEAVFGWLIGCAAYALLVLLPLSYFDLLTRYGLSHRQTRDLLPHVGLLLKLRRARFKNRRKPLEKLILAAMDSTGFTLVDVWAKLDEIGVVTSRARLLMALDGLVDDGVLKMQNGVYAYPTPGLRAVAAVEFRESADALVEEVRRENRLLDDIERFFEGAEFDVRQDAPTHLTGFVLRPRRILYQPYRQLYAWLRTGGALRGDEVDAVCDDVLAKAQRAPPGAGPLTPIVFFIVTEQPEVEAFRRMRAWQDRVRLLPLSTATIRSALRDHSAQRDLDRLAQQTSRRADLYDIRTPVIDRLDFFGRADALAQVQAALERDRRMYLRGLPGSGKTSLLWALKETLVNPVVAYADVEYGWQDEGAFQARLLAELAQDLWLKYSRFFDAGQAPFAEALTSLARSVPIGGEGVRVVLLVDGATADPDAAQGRALAHLAELTRSRSDIALALALRDAVAPAEPATWLAPLRREESVRLIETLGARMGLNFTADGLAWITQETGGHPMLLRQLGSAIAQRAPDRAPTEFVTVAPEWVAEALSDYRRVLDAYFDEVWRWCTPEQRAGLRDWAAAGEEEARAHLLKAEPFLEALARSHAALADLLAGWIRDNVEEDTR